MTKRSDLISEWPNARWFATDDATVAALWAYGHSECPNHPPDERCDLCGLYALRAALTAQRAQLASEIHALLDPEPSEATDARHHGLRQALGVVEG